MQCLGVLLEARGLRRPWQLLSHPREAAQLRPTPAGPVWQVSVRPPAAPGSSTNASTCLRLLLLLLLLQLRPRRKIFFQDLLFEIGD